MPLPSDALKSQLLGFFGFGFFETGFLCIALAVLGTHSVDRLASNSEICLPLPPRVLGLQACATTAQLHCIYLLV